MNFLYTGAQTLKEGGIQCHHPSKAGPSCAGQFQEILSVMEVHNRGCGKDTWNQTGFEHKFSVCCVETVRQEGCSTSSTLPDLILCVYPAGFTVSQLRHPFTHLEAAWVCL